MGIIAFLLLGALIGVLCFCLVRFVPMPGEFKAAIPIVGLLLWLAVLFVIVFGIHDVPIPTWRH